jgi:predicted HicB family RNase H-like nuclease
MTANAQPQTVHVITRVPEGVHRRFRHAVLDKGTSMNQVVNDLILKWLEANEEESQG